MTEKVPENFSEIVFLKMFFQTWTNNFLKVSALIWPFCLMWVLWLCGNAVLNCWNTTCRTSFLFVLLLSADSDPFPTAVPAGSNPVHCPPSHQNTFQLQHTEVWKRAVYRWRQPRVRHKTCRHTPPVLVLNWADRLSDSVITAPGPTLMMPWQTGKWAGRCALGSQTGPDCLSWRRSPSGWRWVKEALTSKCKTNWKRKPQTPISYIIL